MCFCSKNTGRCDSVAGVSSENERVPGSGRLRRKRAPGGRPHTVRVTLSTEEYALIHAAAVRAGISDASWLGDAGVRLAARPNPAMPPRGWGEVAQMFMGMRAEIAETRRLLRNIGGNLNDVARAANAGGIARQQARRVLELVDRSVERTDELIATCDTETRAAVDRLRPRRRRY